MAKIYAVTVQRGRISVDVDRYTFVFVHDVGPSGQIELAEVGSLVHGKRDTRIDRDDQVAKQARREAKQLIRIVVSSWLREHPSQSLDSLDNVELWTDPETPRLSAEQRAANQAALQQLINDLATKLKMPDSRA